VFPVTGFGLTPVSVKFKSDYLWPLQEFDKSEGLLAKVTATWAEGYHFTDWIKQSLPYHYDTISDLELIFGDLDGDGVSNFAEYATLSSATVKGSNVIVNGDSFGRPENIAFHRYHTGDIPAFTYGLQMSGNLVDWQDVPFEEVSVRDSADSNLEFVTMSPASDVVLPVGDCFLRLVVSTDIYLPETSNP